jgi:hypothetical protein
MLRYDTDILNNCIIENRGLKQNSKVSNLYFHNRLVSMFSKDEI